MAKLTNQEVFDVIVPLARKQRKKSVPTDKNADYACMYRSPDGCKCFAGMLLTDDEYDSSMEGKSVYGIPLFKDKVENTKFLVEMQVIHDYIEVECWENTFKNIAKEYGLKYTQ